jgi:hypothetical protein
MQQIRCRRALNGKLGILICFASLSFSPQAADIYRWVDDRGRTNLSDSVPDQYRKSATKIDARAFEPTAEQRREAEERARRDRAKAQTIEEDKARSASQDATQAGSVTRPKSSAKVANDCDEQYRVYRESLECFAPYVMANGATRAEAFSKCTPVKDPSPRCGPPKPWGDTSRTY